ncbi:MAG: class II aldolase/adducin family protein [Pigmentiphaga sp.]|uniref:class II aldolase/adducin family protein n=1 Tax=Pigmentiphaga sp. TaxID=1977564 RepID=UPI0029A6129A|nr:class II aldolase/adducin family protein [Pigmentiphaga sp.]MDX3907099.1 class II aldolase/adducin family protein [Pigmentiphaga sp.]
MDPELEALLNKLAVGSRILELEGHGDMSLGHVSLRDPQGRGFWMKRNRVGLGEIIDARDFVLVDFDGNKLAGEGGRHSEWPIHSEILRERADVQVVAHTHARYASILSAIDGPILPFTLDADYFHEIPRHQDEVALVTTKEEGRALAHSLGSAFAVLMANHGVTFCGTSIEHAVCVGVFLERAARIHVEASAVGGRASMPGPAIRARRNAQIMTPVHIEHSWNYFTRKLEWFMATRAAGQSVLFV